LQIYRPNSQYSYLALWLVGRTRQNIPTPFQCCEHLGHKPRVEKTSYQWPNSHKKHRPNDLDLHTQVVAVAVIIKGFHELKSVYRPSCTSKPISELRSVTCRVRSQCYVTLHPTQVTRPALTPARQALFTPEGWMAEFTLVMVMYRNGLPDVRGQSPI